MPTTPIGQLPYPSSTAPPNVPADLQALAAALDAYLPVTINRGTSMTKSLDATPTNDPILKVSLTPGTYNIHAILHSAGPQNADFKCCWSTTGSMAANSRSVIGPAAGTTDVVTAGTLMRCHNTSLAGQITYGTDGTNNSVIIEDLNIVVTTAGVLTLQWSQGTAQSVFTSLNGSSRITVQKTA